MDLIFKRYSSPFVLLDTMFENNQLTSFIIDLIDTVNEEQAYEFWLYKVHDKNYKSFRNTVGLTRINRENETNEKIDVEKIILESNKVLNLIQPKGVDE